MKKLSELPDETEIVHENYGRTTAELVKDEIQIYGLDASQEKWFILIPKPWKPDARKMVEHYVECELDNMYEGWEDRMYSCFDENAYGRLQTLLEEIAAKDKGIGEMYEFGEEIEIDIFPPNDERSA